MWKSLGLIFAVFLVQPVNAQNVILKAGGSAPDLYISHKVAAKENYYSLGRLYNVAPKSIAPYNQIQFESGLTLGQVIKVPLSFANFTQTGELKEGEVAVPVYHTVQAKEGLYRISINYNKVSLEALRKWNKLSADVVSNGTNLVIGYLKVLADQSPLAKKSTRLEKLLPEVSTAKNAEPQKATPPEITKEQPVANPTDNEVKTVRNKEQGNEKPVSNTDNSSAPPSIDFKGGVFKKSFSDENAVVKESGSMGVFKSTSGWQDGKYYCLHNTARPETIIKVTNPSNGRSIYAKVLDMMPDLKQNSGSLILISNAAAEELGINETKAEIKINYDQSNNNN